MKTGSAKGGHFAILPILSLLMIRIVIEDLYEISILVSLYVTQSLHCRWCCLLIFLDKFNGDSVCSSAIFPLMDGGIES